MTLYSYVVQHDNGYAPNPSNGICTLAYCKYPMRRHVEEGDYVVGLAGAQYKGHVTVEWPPVVYAMRVTKVCGFEEFESDTRYTDHVQCDANAEDEKAKTNRVLVSTDFIYWGDYEEPLPPELRDLIVGRNYKCHFSDDVVPAFIKWFNGFPQEQRGQQGLPLGWKGQARRKC